MTHSFVKDLLCVFDKMDAMPFSFVVELEGLLRLLQHTHRCLQQVCSLKPFDLLLDACCGSESTTAGGNRLNAWLQREVLDLLSFGVFDMQQKVSVRRLRHGIEVGASLTRLLLQARTVIP